MSDETPSQDLLFPGYAPGADSMAIHRVGPFPLRGEGLSTQLEELIHRLAVVLQRIQSGFSTPARESARLAARAIESWRTRCYGVIYEFQGRWLLIGFHVELCSDYVVEDWPRIESEPPLVRPLVEALSEQVWWTLLRDHTEQPSWTPLLCLQWAPELSHRAGDGLEGAMTLVRLELEAGSTRHTSRFRLLGGQELEQLVGRDPQSPSASLDPAAELPEPEQATPTPPPTSESENTPLLQLVLPLEKWWYAAEHLARQPEIQDPHRPSQLLLLDPEGRRLPVLSGWLGGELEHLPRTLPVRIAAFYDQPLRVHRLRSARRDQLFNILYAVAVSFLVGAGVVGAVDLLSATRAENERRLGEPAPLPALSFCSEDNQRFMASLRTWISRFSPEGVSSQMTREGDLVPIWCGLFDRADERSWNAGLQAAANACYDALRTSTYAYTEESAPSWAGPGWGNPSSFFTDQKTRVDSLSQLVKGMRDTCRIVVRQHEGQLGRDIVRAHLSDELMEQHPVLKEAGAERPPLEPAFLPAVWTKLQEQGESQLWLERYMNARFLPYDSNRMVQEKTFKAAPNRLLPQDGLWSCYLSLLTDEEYVTLHGSPAAELEPMLGLWGTRFAFPASQDEGVAFTEVSSQVELDGLLNWLDRNAAPEQGPNARAFQCWSVVRDELDRLGYQDVHPLLAAPAGDWPRDRQQLCGQVCQSVYGIWNRDQRLSADKRAAWYVPTLDLNTCIAGDHFREEAGVSAPPALELDMSWAGQLSPTPSQACAFHLLAQERFPITENRQTPLLNIPPRSWAGAGGGARVSDSSRSFLIYYARQLSAYKRRGMGQTPPRSVEGCQHVAAECLTTAMLNTLLGAREVDQGDRYIQDLRLRFTDEVSRGIKSDPFCQLISEELQYLTKSDFKLDERKAEDICLNRIVSTHTQLTQVLEQLAWER